MSGAGSPPGISPTSRSSPRDPRPLPPDEMAGMGPSMTIVGGEVAWRDASVG